MRRPACWNSARRRSVPSCVASSRSRATRSGTHAWSRRSVPIKTKKILSCCKPQTWGWLGQDCPAADIRAYCYPHDLYALQDVDIVLIDGRFRVACALFCFLALRSDVLFDDFWGRAWWCCASGPMSHRPVTPSLNDRCKALIRRHGFTTRTVRSHSQRAVPRRAGNCRRAAER